MSWFSDAIGGAIGNQWQSYASGAKQFGFNDLSAFLQNEADKGALRGAEVEGVLSGVPIVGDVLRGLNGVQQMEDLYDRTGQTVAYGASQNLGTSALGHASDSLTRKIESGSNDLAEFYSGDRDINHTFDNVNGYRGPHVVYRGGGTEYRNFANI